VASGTPWLGALPVDNSGPVLVFAGEGGEEAIVRRIRAICAGRDLSAEDLPITICTRAPHLGDLAHLHLMRQQLEGQQPRLVVLDPLYLAAGGANGKDIYEMGRLLERPQHLCGDVGAALFVVTHYNRREGRGPQRFTGAGPAEWGRVLIGAAVISRHTDRDTRATTVLTELDAIGGENPDLTFRLRRHIRADDPDDLGSPLHYDVSVLSGSEIEEQGESGPEIPPAGRKLLEALRALARPATGRELVDWIADKHGHGLKRETVSRHLNTLMKDGAVDCLDPAAREKQWLLPDHVTGVTVTRDGHADADHVTGVTSSVRGHASDHTSQSHVDDGQPCTSCGWPTDSAGHAGCPDPVDGAA